MRINNYVCFFLAGLCSSLFGLNAQVTIGVIEQPVSGALLQIKNKENVPEGTNADKGLLLPRVFLDDADKLSPMYSYTGADTPTADDILTHTGLVVYNMNQCLVRKGEDAGVYVWKDGSWSSVQREELAPNVSIFTDPRDDEKYKTGDFGAAGVWMLENMRATIYDQSPLAPPNLSYAISNTAKNYIYPASPIYSPGGNGKDMATYEKDNTVGLLYNWLAATNGENPANNVEQGNMAYPTHPLIQGICPKGWHLPSDKEWTDLENYIIQNTSKYSTMNDIKVPIGPTAIEMRGTHGTAMKAPCKPVGINTAPTGVGVSFPVTKGGFFGMMVGFSFGGAYGISDYGYLSYYWTSSSTSLQGAYHSWMRGLGNQGVYRKDFVRTNFVSVRCKKNS
ncbi:FISUMP domain-containing protein [Prevotella sp. 10(H)]|uniref:FISUMP domain-containing protein n=1 Tax=Prevotella sp. 10(H) TaxID=1158294 RepID=UPI0004A6C7A7|nr:FISUMP domain-containing protein [Prevotella sp. 10(H)]